MNKTQYFLRKYSSTILTVIGATGVVTTAVLSVKATPKALTLIEEVKKEKGDDLTTSEIIKAAWKPYIPAAITCCSTIACIFGANILNTRDQASLMSAYAFLDNSYKQYRNKVNDIYGEDADTKVKTELIEPQADDMEIEDGKVLFFDFQSMRHFTSTMKEVMQAECEFLDLLRGKGYATLNEYYKLLHIPPVSFGDKLGWFDMERIDPYGCEELEFGYEETTMRNGMKCWIIDTNLPPVSNYIL